MTTAPNTAWDLDVFELICVCFEFIWWTLIPIAFPCCIWEVSLQNHGQIETKETYPLILPHLTSRTTDTIKAGLSILLSMSVSWWRKLPCFMGKRHFLQMGNARWSQVFPSPWCVLPPEGTAGCLVADLPGRVWPTQCPVTTKQSPIVHFGIPPLSTVLRSCHTILPDLLPIYLPSWWVSWWAPPMSLPPMDLLRTFYSSHHSSAGSHTSPSQSLITFHTAQHTPMHKLSTCNAILPERRDCPWQGMLVLVLFKCVQAPAFMPWVSEPLNINTEALKPQKFMSSWEVVGRTFWKTKFGAMVKIQPAGCKSQFSS